MRAGIYSPNHIGNDAAIFNVVTEQLRKRGCEVKVYSEEQFAAGEVKERYILNMCREPASIARLQKLEDDGAVVINSGYGIENCIRERLTRILVGSGIDYPKSLIVRTNEVVKDKLEKEGFTGCWVKRGDSHTQHKEDVTFVRHPEEAQEVLQEYFMRGIDRAVVSVNVRGELIKFYGVRGQGYFNWFFTHSMEDALPSVREARENFDEKSFRKKCDKISDLLDVVVYGGDAVLTAEGEVKIIDFNDWPSFAPCRQEAGAAIAKAMFDAIKAANRS